MADNRPRSRSTSAAYRRPSDNPNDHLETLFTMQDLAGQAADLDNIVAHLQHDTAQRRLLAGLISELPRLTEQQLVALGEADSPCPICLTPFLALIAEEEMALVMDSPAHPIEDLGVTRLASTCGHIFCRKDIAHWMREGRNSCPKCRRALVVSPDASAGNPSMSDNAEVEAIPANMEDLFAYFRRGPGQSPGWQARSNPSVDERDDRDEFVGMYS